ncbi:hypothetical protein K9M79_05610 [Candidatus Woesearchaeota archaeon]|nr:hypothetical protein [Candidatus Woesearchaeota archaeon]
MNIQNTQKMNNMIEELTRHGQVNLFDNPYEFASKMFNDAVPESKEAEEQPVQTIIQEVPKTINEGHVKFLIDQKMNELKSHMNAVIASKFDRMHEEIRSLKVKPVHPEEEVKPQTQLKTEPVKVENHPRSGGFNSSDVSIEKIFYAGTR